MKHAPQHTSYFKLPLDSLGPPRIACTRLEAAGRRIAQQFFVKRAIDLALVEPPVNFSVARLAEPVNMLWFAEQQPLRHASRVDIASLLRSEGDLLGKISAAANKAHFKPGDWVKIITRLQSRKKVAEAQLIIDAIESTNEPLTIEFLVVALRNANSRGDTKKWTFYAEACPLPRIPIPYPARQLQIVLSNSRNHQNPHFPKNRSLHERVWPCDTRDLEPLMYELARGYQKQNKPRLLDCVMWWAHTSARFSSRLANINMSASIRWKDEQRAWWTWQQVQQLGLDNELLRKHAVAFKGIALEGNAHVPQQLLLDASNAVAY